MKKLYFLTLLFLLTISTNAQVVISQLYGGGGNSGATYKNDFVELFNKGAVTVDVSNWSIQYASATGTSWAVNAIPATTTIAPGKYLLIQLGGGATGIDLPTADVTGTSNMSATNGKVALVNSTTALSGANVTSGFEDLIGYGSGSSFETTAFPSTGINNTLSIQRANNGCNDTNDNSADFALGNVTPRNSATPAYSCSSISLSIDSPSNGALLSPLTTSVDVAFTVSNFTVANGTGDGYISYSINGGTAIDKFDTSDITIPVTQGQSYSVAMELVDNSGNPLSTPVTASVVFSVDIIYVMSDLASLRADVITNGVGRYYEVTSNPVISYARATRNQKYIQDATAGILIDDNSGTITTVMAQGDAISGLRGQTSIFNGVLQLLPIEDATVFSSSNTITPQIVTIADILGDIEAYESELVQINGATFAAGDGINTFAVNTNYDITDGTTMAFRSMFAEANYVVNTDLVPSGANNITVLVAEFNGTPQVVARDLSDLTLSTKSFDAIEGLTMYPNPLSGNILNFSSTANASMSVQIYNILGKEVAKGNIINNTFNTGNLNAGVYIVKVTEEGKTATRKLVVK